MKHITRTILSLLITVYIHSGQAQTLAQAIDNAIDTELPHATVGVLIKDPLTQKVLYARHANKLLYPASGMKLLTAAAVLSYFGPNYQYTTTLSQKNKDIYLTFTGAPDISVDAFKQLLTHLNTLKNKVIPGNIIIDISHHAPPYFAAGISYDDIGWYYAAPETAIILNENQAEYTVTSAKTLNQRVQIQAKTAYSPLTIINQVLTVSQEQAHKDCGFHIEILNQNTLRLFGCLAQSKAPQVMSFMVPDPLFLAKQLIIQSLKNNGIRLQGQIIIGHTPKDTKLIATLHSHTLSEMVKHMLQHSDNLYAGTLSRLLAYSLFHEGTGQQAAVALKTILSERFHLDMTQIELFDGIGTRYNLITPAQMAGLLTTIYQNQPLYRTLLDTLPQAATSGTLQHRMQKTILAHIVYAKTGTMHDISSLSGYMLPPHQQPIVFSIIINGIHVPVHKAKALEERILTIIGNKMY